MKTLHVTRISVVEKKYDPDQPRAPKGSEIGGQWVDEGGAAGGVAAPTADVNRASENSGKLYYNTSDVFLAKLDSLGKPGNAQRLADLLRKDGYFCEVQVGWTESYNKPAVPDQLTILAEYRDPETLERAGRVIIEVEEWETGVLRMKTRVTASGDHEEFLNLGLDEILDEAAPDFGWTPWQVARVTPLAPVTNTDYYSDRERDLLAYRYNYDPDSASHQQQREEAKTDGEAALTRDGLDADLAHEIQRAWANTSNDSGSWQDVMQVEALERFSIKDVARIQVTRGMSTVRDTRREYPENAAEGKRNIQTAYNSVYRRTQEYFQEKGLGPDDEIVLYRGVKKDPSHEVASVKPGNTIRIEPRPLSSWSLSYRTARHFALPGSREEGMVYAVRVPVKNIFAHASTGYGCLSEEECIVLGNGLLDRDLELVEKRLWT